MKYVFINIFWKILFSPSKKNFDLSKPSSKAIIIEKKKKNIYIYIYIYINFTYDLTKTTKSRVYYNGITKMIFLAKCEMKMCIKCKHIACRD